MFEGLPNDLLGFVETIRKFSKLSDANIRRNLIRLGVQVLTAEERGHRVVCINKNNEVCQELKFSGIVMKDMRIE